MKSESCPQVIGEFSSRSTKAEEQAAGRPTRPIPLSVLLSLLTLVALIPFLTLAGYHLSARVQNERAAEIARLSELAADLARSVDRELRGHIETAQVLTGSRYLQQGSISAFWEHAEDAASRASGHFILIDRSHQQLVNTRRPVGSPLPRTANPGGADLVFETGEVRVGNLGVGAVAQQRLFAVRLPVRIGDEVRYVLSYVPRADAMLAIVQETYRPEGWRGAVVDANGLIIARSHRHAEFFGRSVAPEILRRLTGKTGVLETVDLEGNPSLTAYHASELSDWTVFVWAHRALLEEPVRAAQRTLMQLISLALAASILAAYLASRLIRKPNMRLVQVARDLGEGKPVRFEPSVMREANLIGEALSDAAQTIRAREAALRESEANMQIVMRELSHRSKNLLAIIQALVSQSARLSPDFDHFQSRFQERLAGLAHSHDLLVQREWTSVPLDELLTAQLTPFTNLLDRRVSFKGPRLLLKPQAAQCLGMAFHELATNAMKYGSLSVASGEVNVTWERLIDTVGVERVRLRWVETGGPPPVAPARKGFGSVVIEKITPASLHGAVRLDWRREGLAWEIEVPASHLVAE
jgi:two-component sensor histidine kinase